MKDLLSSSCDTSLTIPESRLQLHYTHEFPLMPRPVSNSLCWLAIYLFPLYALVVWAGFSWRDLSYIIKHDLSQKAEKPSPTLLMLLQMSFLPLMLNES